MSFLLLSDSIYFFDEYCDFIDSLILKIGDYISVYSTNVGTIIGTFVSFDDSSICIKSRTGLNFHLFFSEIFSIEKII